jgi:hypothetical protein
MASSALLFLVGPRQISDLFQQHSLKNIYNDPVKDMPFFIQHKKMYPETLVNPEVSVFFAQKLAHKSFIKTQSLQAQEDPGPIREKVLSSA